MIIGIDNGLDGGLAVLSPVAGVAPVAMTPMPTRAAAGGGREVDVLRLVEWIRAVPWEEPPLIVVEECPQHSRDKRAMRSMAFTAGMIIGSLTAKFPQCRLVRVRSGNSRDSWQRAVLGRVPAGGTKAAALAAARSLWREETWLAGPRCRVPHDGLVDAALIAEHGRRAAL
jgi:hypothetical protein